MPIRIGSQDLAGQLRIGDKRVARAYLGALLVFSAAPAVLTVPYITGTAEVGQVLTSNRGTWASYETPTYARQWLRDGAAISGATGTTYELVSADEGKIISVRVTATNGAGASVSVAAGTTPVAGGVPVAPAGFQMLLGQDGRILTGADGAPLYGKAA